MLIIWITIRSWLSSLWKSIRNCWTPRTTTLTPPSSKPSLRDPYNPRLDLRLRLVIPGENGSIRYEEDTTKWGSVSRHGLLQAGIKCPYCGHVAAQTGKFDLIHKTRFGEAVNCAACLAVLLASPDDDIDPVKPGQDYDPSIYHTFVRSTTARRIGQRLTKADPLKGDWIVIVTEQPVGTLSNPDVKTNFFGTEGRVDAIGPEGRYTVALGGNHGIGGAGSDIGQGLGGSWAVFDRDQIAVMVQPILRARDTVRITQGPRIGQSGIVQSVNGSNVVLTDVHDCAAPLELPLERVQKVVDNELVI